MHLRSAAAHLFASALLVAATLAAGCGGGSASTDPRAGLGASTARPSGAAWSLPSGVELRSPIYGDQIAGDCETTDAPLGVFGPVYACMRLANVTSSTVTITFPAGLIFISKDVATQNGMLAVTETIQIPAQTERVVVIQLDCLNLLRHGSQDTDRYEIGPVTSNPGLQEVLGIVATKHRPFDGYEFLIQQAIWDVTDGQGLEAETRAELNAMP